jgi:hypothetical protein
VLVSETSPAENRLQLYDEVISSESWTNSFIVDL